MKKEKHMPITGLTTKDPIGWVNRAVNFGAIPHDAQIMTHWLDLLSKSPEHGTKILTHTPCMFEPKPGFSPMEKDSNEYKAYSEKNSLENSAAHAMAGIKNKMKY